MNEKTQHLLEIATQKRGLIYKLVNKIVANRENSDDVLQNVFLNILLYGENYDSQKSRPITWISKIAFRRSLDFINKRKNYYSLPERLPTFNNVEAFVDEEEEKFLLEKIQNSFDYLEPQTRYSAICFYFFNDSRVKLAEETGASVHEIALDLECARRQIRKRVRTVKT